MSVYKTACCIVGSINSALICEGFDAPTHSYLSAATKHIPTCAGHGFVMVSKSRTSFQNAYGYENLSAGECARRGVDLFEVIIGECGPPPPIMRKSNACDGDVYGACSPCDTPQEDLAELCRQNEADCLPVQLIDNGEGQTPTIVWPEGAGEQWTETDMAACVWAKQEAIKCHFEAKFCFCHQECYGKEPKVKPRILEIEDWCMDRFVGSKLTIAALT